VRNSHRRSGPPNDYLVQCAWIGANHLEVDALLAGGPRNDGLPIAAIAARVRNQRRCRGPYASCRKTIQAQRTTAKARPNLAGKNPRTADVTTPAMTRETTVAEMSARVLNWSARTPGTADQRSPLANPNVKIRASVFMRPNDRTERRGRPNASDLATDVARPCSLQ
jgi:hypothetical protein